MARDWLKDAGDVFSRLGQGLKSATEEARKAAGIGLGSIAVALDRHELAPGDAVTGKVVLGLNEPVEANRLVVALIGTQRMDGATDETVFELEHELDGPGSYRVGEYPFDLGIPEDAVSGPEGDIVESVTRAVTSLATGRRAPTSWRVVAWLDIPRARNIRAKVDIVVAEK